MAEKRETKLESFVATPSKILSRIRELKKAVEDSSKRLHRQKVDLWQNVYLYCETLATKEGASVGEVYQKLVSSVGGHLGYWSRARRCGEFIRRNRLDCEQLLPSSLSHVASCKIDPKDLPRLARMLNDGVGPSEIRQALTEMGYRKMPPIPLWRRKEIRRHKKTWSDWEPEMAHLISAIRHTTDGKVDLELSLSVNGESIVSVRS